GVFGDSQFTSTLSVNFHFPKIPRRTFFMGMGLRMGRAGGDDHDGGEAVFSPLLRQLLAGGYGMD
ncbi:hypothetical protein, partial [Aeromonas sp. QDB04]|uniref:hypothetical protein n=2 Tax=Aeromonas TaxID=642 RepID=UPI0022E217AE